MLRHFHFYFLSLTLLLLSHTVSAATTVEAIGQAIVRKNDMGKAREEAIADAKQQASLQAAAFISSTQQIENGILEIDNMRISTLSSISNVEILEETMRGNTLHVHIRADVNIEEACENGNTGNSFRKNVAIAAFPMQYPAQGNLGGLKNIESIISAQISARLNKQPNIFALNAGNLRVHQDLNTAASRQLDDGTLTTMMDNTQQLDTQYIVSGVIRDLSMLSPNIVQEKNWLVDTYNRLDYKSDKHLRHFSVEIFIYDGFSGTLLEQMSYETQGMWNLQGNTRTGFATPAFLQTDYGQKVDQLLNNAAYDLSQSLRCLPFSARITRVEDSQIWINAGKSSGLRRGDRLTIYRKNMFYNPTGNSTTELINTRLSLTINDVQPTSASGSINVSASQENIQPDDIVMFW
jgi:hypothetical protein